MDAKELKNKLTQLFEERRVGVLATHDHGQPYGSLVAFLASDDLVNLVFTTGRGTRKFANLSADPRVALVVDDRRNEAADFYEAAAVTASGRAQVLDGEEAEAMAARFVERHPQLHLRQPLPRSRRTGHGPMRHVVPLERVTAHDFPRVGGKAVLAAVHSERAAAMRAARRWAERNQLISTRVLAPSPRMPSERVGHVRSTCPSHEHVAGQDCSLRISAGCREEAVAARHPGCGGTEADQA
jgi:nitroimidazol reductase NimA-like FMN-containing flavoprotein (pyridoxamine 5'-phosphate oxidase superfamily)